MSNASEPRTTRQIGEAWAITVVFSTAGCVMITVLLVKILNMLTGDADSLSIPAAPFKAGVAGFGVSAALASFVAWWQWRLSGRSHQRGSNVE